MFFFFFLFLSSFSKENGIYLNWKPLKWLFIDVITESLLWILIFEEALTALVKESAVWEKWAVSGFSHKKWEEAVL